MPTAIREYNPRRQQGSGNPFMDQLFSDPNRRKLPHIADAQSLLEHVNTVRDLPCTIAYGGTKPKETVGLNMTTPHQHNLLINVPNQDIADLSLREAVGSLAGTCKPQELAIAIASSDPSPLGFVHSRPAVKYITEPQKASDMLAQLLQRFQSAPDITPDHDTRPDLAIILDNLPALCQVEPEITHTLLGLTKLSESKGVHIIATTHNNDLPYPLDRSNFATSNFHSNGTGSITASGYGTTPIRLLDLYPEDEDRIILR